MDKLTHAINELTVALNQVTLCLQATANSELSSEKHLDPEPIATTEQAEPVAAQPEQTSPSQPTVTNDSDLPEAFCNWFRKYQLGFVQFNHKQGNTERIRQLSVHIARHHNDVERLMTLLNQWANGSRTLNLNLRNKAVEVIAQTTNVANQMNEIGFLQHYQYKRSPHCFLRVQSNGLPATQSYLKGKWFELAIEQQLIELKRSVPDLEWIANPVIRTTKGQQREVDFIVSLQGQIYVIEVTTAAWQKKATQVISLANQLQLPIKQCLIVSPEHEPQLMQEFSELHGANVLSFEQFSQWIEQQLEQSEAHASLENVTLIESCTI